MSVSQSVSSSEARRRLRILVADDQAINRKLTTHRLERLGFAVDVVVNGRQAVDAASRTAYDLIFMDCHMPDLDGFEATRQIRSREGGARRTPIIALTATIVERDRNRCLAAGMDDYMVKPISEPELVRVLSLWLMEPLIDGETIRRLQQIGDSDAVLFEVIALFMSDAPSRIASIHDAVRARDPLLLVSAAHALKGSAGNVGAPRLQQVCSELEAMGRNGDLTGAATLAERLDAEYDRAVPALQELRKE